jgi:hypothetical protein
MKTFSMSTSELLQCVALILTCTFLGCFKSDTGDLLYILGVFSVSAFVMIRAIIKKRTALALVILVPLALSAYFLYLVASDMLLR